MLLSQSITNSSILDFRLFGLALADLGLAINNNSRHYTLSIKPLSHIIYIHLLGKNIIRTSKVITVINSLSYSICSESWLSGLANTQSSNPIAFCTPPMLSHAKPLRTQHSHPITKNTICRVAECLRIAILTNENYNTYSNILKGR